MNIILLYTKWSIIFGILTDYYKAYYKTTAFTTVTFVVYSPSKYSCEKVWGNVCQFCELSIDKL